MGAPVFLCGMMGSGKSTVGRALADRLGAVFVDLDRRVERLFGLPVAEAFAHGEPHFRRLETEALRSLIAEPAFPARTCVVATGGGAILNEDNRSMMDGAGARVLLEVPTAVLAARLQEDSDQRPLVATTDDVALELERLWQSRRTAYETAPVVVDGDGEPATVVDRVISALDLSPQTGETDA